VQHYRGTSHEIVAQVDIEDLGVVIAWSEVESLTIFDDNLYKALLEQTPSPAAVQLPVR
jgi:hypothetical protein